MAALDPRDRVRPATAADLARVEAKIDLLLHLLEGVITLLPMKLGARLARWRNDNARPHPGS